MSAFACMDCGLTFNSRNKLFFHLRVCLHKRLEASSTSFTEGQNLDVLLSSQDVRIYVCGGRLRNRTLQSCEYYSFKEQQWFDAPSLVENRGSHGCSVIDNCLYIVGGGGLHSNLNTCEVLQIDENENEKFCLLPSVMNTTSHALATTCHLPSRSIFSIGGWKDGSMCLNTVERLDIDTKTWTLLSNRMNVARRLHSCCTLQNKLYVFGGQIDANKPGTDQEWVTDSAECYDLTINEPIDDNNGKDNDDAGKRTGWQRINNMPIASITACVSIEDLGLIYVFLQTQNKVYRYLPESDEYIALCKLPLKQWYGFTVTTLGTKIFLMGGITNGTWTNSFFEFDILSNTFKELPSMKQERRRCASGLVVLSI
jgi:hypothetical protein